MQNNWTDEHIKETDMKQSFVNITSRPVRIENWRVDDDGFLRVTMCILKEGVYEYRENEIDPEGGRSDSFWNVYIPESEFSTPSAMVSIEGKPLVRESHDWRDVENTSKDRKTIGNIAGSAIVKDGGLYVDGLITDLQTSTDIQSGKLVEVSAGYISAVQNSSGTFNGSSYEFIQTGIEFNHAALLEAGRGRCGHDVRIINSEKPLEVRNMVISRVKIGNEMTVLKFSEESEAIAVENAFASQEKHYDIKLAEVQATRDKAQDVIKELEKQLKVANAKIRELSNPEVQADIVQAAQEQLKYERAILASVKVCNEDKEEELENEDSEELENEDSELENEDSEDKELENEVSEELENEDTEDKELENEDSEEEKKENSFRKNALGNKALAKRRVDTVKRVMTANGVAVPSSWTQEQYDAAFSTLVMQSKIMKRDEKKVSKTKVPAAGVTSKMNNGYMDARSRMLQPMKFISVNGNK